MNISRLKNQMLSKTISLFPSLSKKFIHSFTPREFTDIPWTPVTKPLQDSKIAIVTTSGVHHKDQKPFDMNDKNGDPTFRVIDATGPVSGLMITHDYYDHSDADRDINIVFPLERLRWFRTEGIIGEIASTHYGFMGHIDGQHIQTLIDYHAPEVAGRLKEDKVDVVLLTPA